MLSDSLQVALDQCLEGVSLSHLQKKSEELSRVYRSGGTSRSIFDNELGALAYLATRMPATFGSVDAVLAELEKRIPGWSGKSVIDLGAGPGTASWAAAERFASIEQAVRIDHNLQAIQWGKKLANAHPVLSSGEWIHSSLTHANPFPKGDLAICSYALTELDRASLVIDKIWKSETPIMIVIEPGTPQGFQRIKAIREQWLKLGGYLAAPCPHAFACPMPQGDWCHFSVRIARTKLHRLLKGGDLGYEDEKFSYLIGTRAPIDACNDRILRHPVKHKGFVEMTLCAQSGHVENRKVARREGDLYRLARDAEWGGAFPS